MLRRLVPVVAVALLVACESGGPSTAPAPEASAAPEPTPLASISAEPVPAATVTVTSKTLTVRETPSTKGVKTTTTLKRGQQLPVLEERGGWTRLGLPSGGSGWVDARYVSKKPPCPADRPASIVGEPVLAIDTTGPRGRVVVEADVDEGGTVRSTRVISNSGAAELGPKAESELKRMRFSAPVKECRARRFIYTYTRTF